MLSVYLAGPEVFRPDAAAVGAARKRLCARHGVEGLWPLDNEEGEPSAIAHANMAMLRRARAVIANLSPFRGVSADPGTVFEVGFAAALGLPIYAFTTDGRDLADRVAEAFNRHMDPGRGLVDHAGLAVEDFGLFENLMVPAVLTFLARGIANEESGFAICLGTLRNHGTT